MSVIQKEGHAYRYLSPMNRQPDWESRLATFITREMHQAFVWGETDCTALTLNAIDVMCMTLVKRYYVRWHTHLTAMRATRDLSFKKEFSDGGLWQEVDGLEDLQAGDVIVVSHPDVIAWERVGFVGIGGSTFISSDLDVGVHAVMINEFRHRLRHAITEGASILVGRFPLCQS